MVCCCLPGTVVILIIILVIVKIFFKLSIGWDHSSTCLIGKTTIVTGANTGIGFHTALDFAKRGARVILACRDKKRANRAKNIIIEQTGNSNVVVRILDLTSLASVRAFAKEIKDREERLDILVNNAGVGALKNSTSGDGLNLLMQVNYFGPTLLTFLLVDLLKKSAPSRIVNVSSVAAVFGKVDPNNLNAWPKTDRKSVNKRMHYCNSKLCNILFTNELARKLKGSGVVANSLHPGTVGTEIWRVLHPITKAIIEWTIYLLFKNPEEGAQTSIYVAVSKDIEGVTGEYFENCRIAWIPSMPIQARDEELCKKVWEKTEELIKLTSEERNLLLKS